MVIKSGNEESVSYVLAARKNKDHPFVIYNHLGDGVLISQKQLFEIFDNFFRDQILNRK